MSLLKFKNSSLWEQKLPIVAQVICLAIVLYYLYCIIISAGNHTYHLDDTNFYLKQFQSFWLDKEGLLEKLPFFIEQGNWPHPKIIGRTFTLMSYGIFGEVNFSFIYIIGNLCTLLSLAFYLKLTKLHWLWCTFLVLASSVFYSISFWAVSIVGFGYLVSFIVGSLYFLYNKSYKWAWLFLFLGSFSSGIGLFLFPMAILYVLIDNRKDWKTLLFYLISFILVLVLFYYFPLDGKLFNKDGNEAQALDVGLLISNLTKFIGYIVPSSYQLVVGILGLVGFAVLSVINFTSSRVNRTLCFAGLFIIFIGLVSVYINQSRGVVYIPNRYLIFSVNFWIILALMFSNTIIAKEKSEYFHLITALILFIAPFANNPFYIESTKRSVALKNHRLKKFNGLMATDVRQKTYKKFKNQKNKKEKARIDYLKEYRFKSNILEATEAELFTIEN